ncbi:MAG: hypothetical protein ABSH52_25970 [Terriglobia bacterium]|jgi:hypothetical protein
MATTRITIPLDPATAKAYKDARPEEKKKIQAIVRIWLRDLSSVKPGTLSHLLDEVSEKAVQRGLTSKILGSLLKGA